MKIFITGGSGFVGTTLTQKLTDLGHQVTILTRLLKPGQTLHNPLWIVREVKTEFKRVLAGFISPCIDRLV